MYMNNLLTNVLTLGGSGSSSHPETRVKYTQSSGLADWSDEIVGELNQNLIPNRTYVEIVDIGDSVTGIGNSAFQQCGSLTSITIGENVTSIGNSAFNLCSGLTGALAIPNGVTSIGNYAFQGCSGLTSVVIPSSMTSIGNNAFYVCKNITDVYISDIGCWFGISFSNASSNPFYYGADLYLNGEKVTNLTIPNTVTSIGDYKFYGCRSLTNVTIPNTVTSIGIQAFYRCSGLTSVTIPNSVTNIGRAAFYNCNGLTSVTIGNNIENIGAEAFAWCSGLTRITFGSYVTNIGTQVFRNCNCTVFDFRKSTSIPTLQNVNAFQNTPSNKEIIVPDSLYDDWKATNNWNSSTNNIVNRIVKASQSSLGSL